MTRYAVLITQKENSESLGVLELDPTGLVIVSTFAGGIHPYALKPVVNNLLDQPLYAKYAELLSRLKTLPAEVLKAEADGIARLVNERSMKVMGMRIGARIAERE
jgi:hypothetical protein